MPSPSPLPSLSLALALPSPEPPPQPSPLAPAILRGRHVVLEPLRREHATELWPAAAEPDVWLYMGKRVAAPADLAAWVEARVRMGEEGAALPFLQRDARTGAAFGSTSLFDVDLAHKRAEIGHTWIGASHRRTAANTEAKLLLFAHGFDVLGLNRIQLKTDARNLRSQRAIERLGAVREGVLRKHMVVQDGYVRDSVVYSVVRDEWPAVRARLEALLSAR